LGKAGLLPQFVNSLGNLAIGDSLLESLPALWVMAGDIRQNLGCISGGLLIPKSIDK
jgi:hypothetical protein